MKRATPAVLLLAALAGTHLGAASARPTRPKAPMSLCRVPERALFTCKISSKVVSICGQPRGEHAQGGAVYRFGRPGRIDLEVANLHHAEHGTSGGGDAEVYADTPTHRYVVYDTIVRTGFGPSGHFDPQEVFGLLVQSGGKTVSNRTCTEPVDLDPLVGTLMPKGDYVDHDVTLRPLPPETE
jgi:hypothetical protein